MSQHTPTTREYNEARATVKTLRAEYDRLESGDEYDATIEARMGELVEQIRNYRATIDTYQAARAALAKVGAA